MSATLFRYKKVLDRHTDRNYEIFSGFNTKNKIAIRSAI